MAAVRHTCYDNKFGEYKYVTHDVRDQCNVSWQGQHEGMPYYHAQQPLLNRQLFTLGQKVIVWQLHIKILTAEKWEDKKQYIIVKGHTLCSTKSSESKKICIFRTSKDLRFLYFVNGPVEYSKDPILTLEKNKLRREDENLRRWRLWNPAKLI